MRVRISDSMRKAKLQEKIKNLSIAISEIPHNVQAFSQRGTSYHKMAKVFLTEHNTEKYLSRSRPKSFFNSRRFHKEFSVSQLSLNDFVNDKIMPFLVLSSITLTSENLPQYEKKIDVKMLQCDTIALYNLAIADFSEAINIADENSHLLLKRAKAYIEVKEYIKAYEDLALRLKSKPGCVESYYLQMSICKKKGQLDKFLKVLSTLIAQVEKNETHGKLSIYTGIINLCLALRVYNPALKLMKQVINNNVRDCNKGYYEARAKIFTELGNYGDAIKDYSEIISSQYILKSNLAVVHWERGLLYEKCNQPDKAFADYKKAVENDGRYQERLAKKDMRAKAHKQINTSYTDVSIGCQL